MRVLVAGASSVPGLPVVRELVARGHTVVGVTHSQGKTAQIAAAGARPMPADVFDAAQIAGVVGDFEPEVVVSLLTTLPKRGPMRMRDFKPAQKLWGLGAPNLVAAAQQAGVRRIVAESVIFAYGYAPTGPPLLDESEPYPWPPPPGGEAMLAALRSMEQTVLSSGDHSDTEGIVLRYGAFYGPGVPHTKFITRLVKWWALPVPSGNGILSWIDIRDVARATVAALDHGRGGQIYNIVDDEPMSFRDYARTLAAAAHRPPPVTLPRRLLGLGAPYVARAFGQAWLPLSNAKAKAELGWSPTAR
ncbi:MAG: NAD-dependent epimerase/dehydratase family protein [Mycobacterium sp.]